MSSADSPGPSAPSEGRTGLRPGGCCSWAGADPPSHHTPQVPPGPAPGSGCQLCLGQLSSLDLCPLRCNGPPEVGKGRHPFPLFFLLQEEQLQGRVVVREKGWSDTGSGGEQLWAGGSGGAQLLSAPAPLLEAGIVPAGWGSAGHQVEEHLGAPLLLPSPGGPGVPQPCS